MLHTREKGGVDASKGKSTCYFYKNKSASHASPASKEDERQLPIKDTGDYISLKNRGKGTRANGKVERW